ncbi:hypothetical protein YOLOSWAG_254 [Erwinia phage vB_EamM_Yoloswag]|uniref:Uncharacterized protein n=1 Tax=Erwinia phage vB_EamM_Yoloswag TaxID=1958956 RepID=A0A1S6L3H2_9CAUD|nr:hypothetical protein HOR66_gp254 [Erwinia phage vB_EamM_Yoloswag]AQT28728.1 hypothetical protein YOLOSWAG_254 [Erwinia phage vB_EamM_Yoloswag]
MTALYIKSTEAQIRSGQLTVSSIRVKNLHLLKSIFVLVEREGIDSVAYTAEVLRATVRRTPRSAQTATLEITIDQYRKRPAHHIENAYFASRFNTKHVLADISPHCKIKWERE